MAFRQQRAVAIFVLFSSVAAGMHIARGQVPPQPYSGPSAADIPMPPVPKAGDFAPTGNQDPNLNGYPASANPGAAPGTPPNGMPRAAMPQGAQPGAMNPQGAYGVPPVPPPPPPPFPVLATPVPTLPKSEAFVPSEVVPYSGAPIKIGEPRAIVRTSFGDIKIKLYSTQAPKLVENFIQLARGEKEFTDIKTGKRVKRPFYSDLIFHRIIKGYLIQTGCPFGSGRGGPGFTMADEFDPNLTFDRPGLVAMAPQRENTKLAKDTNGSQFLITLSPRPEWNGQLSIIGEVEIGMDVVHKIANAKTGPTDRPFRRVWLRAVEIIDEQRPSAESAPPVSSGNSTASVPNAVDPNSGTKTEGSVETNASAEVVNPAGADPTTTVPTAAGSNKSEDQSGFGPSVKSEESKATAVGPAAAEPAPAQPTGTY